MTAVELTFRYQGDLLPDVLVQLQEKHAYFGIRRIKPDPAQKLITVEYDATRLDASGVEAVLRQVGVAVFERARAAT